jgi:hypothetical protein
MSYVQSPLRAYAQAMESQALSNDAEKRWEQIERALRPGPIRALPMKPDMSGHDSKHSEFGVGEGYGRWDAVMANARGEMLHPDLRDVPAVRALLPYRRQPRSDFKSGQGRYPFPVYVATYADGRTARYSFWSRAKKPIDFAAGFNAALILGRGLPVAGHVEHDGVTWQDSHFVGTAEPDSRRVTRARRPSAKDYQRQIAEISMLLARGEIDAAKQVCAQ